MELAIGTLIRTGRGSVAYLQINGYTAMIKVTEDSELDLTEMMGRNTNATRTALEVRKGAILGNVRKLSSESSFQVRGGGVTLKVRGTDFQMSAQGRVDIVTGDAIVTSDGKSYQLVTGEYFDPKKNEVGYFPVINPNPPFVPANPVELWPGAEPLSPYARGLEKARRDFAGH